MKSGLVTVACGLVLAAAVGSVALPVQAAPKQMADGNIFDPEYYAENNPDVVAAFGTDENLLYQHYLLCGQAEGRLPYAQQDTTIQQVSTLIDYNYKLTLYDRTTWNGWTGQYDVTPGGYFDEARYAADYPDIAAIYGTSHDALWQHYSTIGVYEGRRAYVYGYLEGYRFSPRAGLYLVDYYQEASRVPAYIDICDIAASICNAGMSDREKVRAVHDWMLEHMTYDYVNSGHELNYVDGAIYAGMTKCNGYSMAFDGFMAALGIECHYINGQANGFHGWNDVYIEGQWYDMDVTWDDCYYDPRKDSNPSYANQLKYTHFLIPHGTGEFANRVIQYED